MKTSILLVLALIVNTVSAEVIFDPESGQGFVAKADIQKVMNLNNGQFRSQAAWLTFTFTSVDFYVITDASGTRTETIATAVSVNAQLVYDARARGQITGVSLNGWSGPPRFSSPLPSEAAPVSSVLTLSVDLPSDELPAEAIWLQSVGPVGLQ